MKDISNRKLTLLRKLRQKKYRRKERLFLVEGERAVAQVIENGSLEIEHLFFDSRQKTWKNREWREAIERLPSASIDHDEYLEVTDTETPQGVLALCVIPDEVERGDLADGEGVIVATDRIRDPGNLGAMVRSAAWFGVRGMLLGNGTVDLFHPKVVRGTAGATGSVPFRNADLTEELPSLEEEGWRVVLLDAGPGSVSLRQVRPDHGTVLVIGNEAHGIDSTLFGKDRIIARIEPGETAGRSPVESLNASIALSIALYGLNDPL